MTALSSGAQAVTPDSYTLASTRKTERNTAMSDLDAKKMRLSKNLTGQISTLIANGATLSNAFGAQKATMSRNQQAGADGDIFRKLFRNVTQKLPICRKSS
ncbi:hypothetical protein OAI26_03000 [Sulfitobacter sp.]|nr:hypothetical protein [Sulfitobacter sp.]